MPVADNRTAAIAGRKQHLQQPQSFQDFVSATPVAGWIADPRLGLYVDPNIPAGLYPHFIQAAHPTISGMQTVQVPVGAGSSVPSDFLNMIEGTQGLGAQTGQAVREASQQPAPSPTDPFGGWGDLVTAPSSRPNEPVTTGLPFGGGASFVQMPQESDVQFRNRVANALLTSPATDGATRSFARRMQAETGTLFQQEHPGLGYFDPGMSGPNDSTLPTSGAGGERTTGFSIADIARSAAGR